MYDVDLSDRVGLVAGVATRRSIAWAIAQNLQRAGMRLVLPYLSERERRKIEDLVSEELWDDVLIPPDPLDAGDDDRIDALFHWVREEVGRLDGFVHSIAFAPREALREPFSETSREAYRIALDISAYSFVTMTRAASGLMSDGGSVLTLTYMASSKVFPSYNVMGSAKAALEHAVRQLASELGSADVRVNAISAGPVSTVSARGVHGFTDILQVYRKRSPLGRNITADEVGKTALFLLSDLASGVTGEILHVDGGYNIMGL